MDLDTVADRLYALSPEEFTAARDQAVRDASDKALRTAVKALRKPTVAAHAVNVVVRERTGDVDGLLALGDALRAAMGGDPTEVRRLTEQRRELIGRLVDRDLPAAVQQDVTATLEAATADPELGAAVRSGRLVKPLRYAGFGARPDLDDAVATPLRVVRSRSASLTSPAAQAKPAKPAAKTPRGRTPRTMPTADKPRPDLTAARERCLELAGEADDAQRRYELAVNNAAEARRFLEAAEAERAEAHRHARAAHREAEQARREVGRLERA